MKNILVTGGTGYIGSHTCVQLISDGLHPLLFDNLCNSNASVIDRIGQISGVRPHFVQGDIRNRELLINLLRNESIDAVIHFAAHKAVGDSVREPVRYYDNNVGGTLTLLAAMRETGVRTLIFSSSATVYRESTQMPLKENAETCAVSPYGHSKLLAEQMLAEVVAREADWSITSLRYFNAAGAHASALLGEQTTDTPNNLVPFIAQVAAGKRDKLDVFGNDYDTLDGSAVRDYVHVMDLAEGHTAALRKTHGRPGYSVFNLGTGQGYSVLEVLNTFSMSCGRMLPHAFCSRRPGDLAAYWADASLAREILGWESRRGLAQICDDVWRWTRAPHG